MKHKHVYFTLFWVPITSVETFFKQICYISWSKCTYEYTKATIQMLGICIYDIWERFCVAKINITNFTSKNCSTRFSFFVIYLYIHFWLVTKLVQGNLGGTFNPKSRRVLSMKKCIEQVVPRQWSEIHFLGTFPWVTPRPKREIPDQNTYGLNLPVIMSQNTWYSWFVS